MKTISTNNVILNSAIDEVETKMLAKCFKTKSPTLGVRGGESTMQARPTCRKKAKGLGSGGAVAPGVGTATVGMDGIGVAMGAGMGIGGDAGTGPHHLD